MPFVKLTFLSVKFDSTWVNFRIFLVQDLCFCAPLLYNVYAYHLILKVLELHFNVEEAIER